MPECQIICLANSYKHGGRCVAGVRTDGKGWVRPISDAPDGTLNYRDYRLSNGTDVKVLDLVSISLTEPKPAKHQPENWLFEKQPWKLIARPAPSDVLKAVANVLSVDSFLFKDTRDRIPFKEFNEKPAASSLAIVHPSKLEFCITQSFAGNKQLRAKFELAGRVFNLAVTDPVWKDRLSNKIHGTYGRADVGIDNDTQVFLTISLGEPLDGFCYKLVAAVLQVALPVAEAKGKPYSVVEKRITYPNAYARWSAEDDKKLREKFQEGISQQELSKLFQRNSGAIRSRLFKLGLINRLFLKVSG